MSVRSNIIENMLRVPESTWLVSAEDIRDMWMDYNDLQEVFGNLIEQKDPRGYAKCIVRSIVRFNGKLPQTQYSPDNFPDAGLLLDMSFAEVLKVVEAYHTANFNTASGGGTVIPLHERFSAIKALRQEIESDVTRRTQEWKIYISNQMAYGSFDSLDLL